MMDCGWCKRARKIRIVGENETTVARGEVVTECSYRSDGKHNFLLP
jgi:hypothetical protein